MNTCSSVFYNSLKSGMKVRVRPDLFVHVNCPSTSGYNPYIVEEMADMQGQIVTLNAMCDEYRGWWWIDEDKCTYKWPDTAFVPVQKEFNKLLKRRWADE